MREPKRPGVKKVPSTASIRQRRYIYEKRCILKKRSRELQKEIDSITAQIKKPIPLDWKIELEEQLVRLTDKLSGIQAESRGLLGK